MIRFIFGLFLVFGVVGGIDNTPVINQVQALTYLFAVVLGFVSMYFGAVKLQNIEC